MPIPFRRPWVASPAGVEPAHFGLETRCSDPIELRRQDGPPGTIRTCDLPLIWRKTGYKPAALPLSYWGKGGHAGGTRTRMTRVAASDLTDSDTACVVDWRASRDSNPDQRFWRPPSCHWTTDPHGVLARRPGFEPGPQDSKSCVLPVRRTPNGWHGWGDSNARPRPSQGRALIL